MPYPELIDLPEMHDWLVKTLEPMCDADPAVMSDYIIALLKHDAVMDEKSWKDFISLELVDFLADNSRPFVDLLFTTLATKSFLPPPAATQIPPVAPAIKPPTSSADAAAPAIVSSYRPPAFVPNAQPIAGPSTSRPPPSGPANGAKPQPVETDIEMSGVQPGGRQKCHDYHEKGYCMRGVACPYEHSADMIIPSTEMMMSSAFPFLPPSGPPMRGGGMRGRGRGRGGNHHQNGFPSTGMPFAPPFIPGMPMAQPFPHNAQPSPDDPRANFWGSNRPPQDRGSSTLVITDIPPSSLSVQAIREYFSQFGEVTNVAVEGKSARALVSFGTNREAYAAWKSDEAVFGSRHVKVLWHRPRPGQGGAGMEQLEKSKALLANMNSGNTEGQTTKAVLSGPEQRLRATLAELEVKEKRQRKETLVAEQKVLLAKAKNGTNEEKKEILKRLKEIAKEAEDLDKPVVQEEMTDKERLDRELAKHGMETSGTADDELTRLGAQLSALRDKANTLGINASTRYSPYSHPQRGRGSYRARGGRGGGAPRGPMRLDNRSRALLLTGNALDGEAGKLVREHFEGHGGVIETAATGGWKVAYPDRGMAERVLAMGTKSISNLPPAVELNAGWYTESYGNGNGQAAAGNQEVEMAEETRRGEGDDED